ncbi:MAG TPA: response regulator transcription factor [Candidatus Sulfotelmatobacter sp.]|nr:response regulator transcription factor [Candidatus Sulfotelmatobacter sp.]
MSVLSRVLLVENDQKTANILAIALKSSFETDIAVSAKQAIYKCDIYSFDVLVFDLNMPDISGIDFCQVVKQRGVKAPLLFLAKDINVLGKIKLLDSGASDILIKPFSLGELKARLRAVLRHRDESPRIPHRVKVGGLEIDKNDHTFKREGKLVRLRKKEFALLEYLLFNANKVVSRNELLSAVWQDKDELWTNTLDVHIKYLRDKLDRPFKFGILETVHGRGYKLNLSKLRTNNKKAIKGRV